MSENSINQLLSALVEPQPVQTWALVLLIVVTVSALIDRAKYKERAEQLNDAYDRLVNDWEIESHRRETAEKRVNEFIDSMSAPVLLLRKAEDGEASKKG